MDKWECCGVEYKIGDKVRVVWWEDDYAEHGMGENKPWRNSWVHMERVDDNGSILDMGMDGHLGLDFIIADIGDEGVSFETYEYDSLGYCFPLTSLRNLTAEERNQIEI